MQQANEASCVLLLGGGMIKSVFGDIVCTLTCVQYKDEVFDDSILLQTSHDQKQAAEQKESCLKCSICWEEGLLWV